MIFDCRSNFEIVQSDTLTLLSKIIIKQEIDLDELIHSMRANLQVFTLKSKQ